MVMRIALALVGWFLTNPTFAASCVAESGPRTAALVELYTSEGCSSCPPADRWLSGLAARGYGPDRVVPLSLHVDYWDYIGWKDPYAKREFSLRQRKLSQLQRMALVYTPQVVLQGRDFRQWGGKAFDEAVAKINAQPAGARIRLELLPGNGAALDVSATVALATPGAGGEPSLYLAAYQNRLESRVTSGENRGRRLAHDYVVLEWQGPFAIGPAGRLAERRALPLVPKALPANSGVAAFVQDRSTAQVLQALMLPACSS
jgi:hypothetical protein